MPIYPFDSNGNLNPKPETRVRKEGKEVAEWVEAYKTVVPFEDLIRACEDQSATEIYDVIKKSRKEQEFQGDATTVPYDYAVYKMNNIVDKVAKSIGYRDTTVGTSKKVYEYFSKKLPTRLSAYKRSKPIYPIDSNGRPHETREKRRTFVDALDDTIEILEADLKLANDENKLLKQEVKRLTAEGERMIKQLDKAWNKEQLARG